VPADQVAVRDLTVNRQEESIDEIIFAVERSDVRKQAGALRGRLDETGLASRLIRTAGQQTAGSNR